MGMLPFVATFIKGSNKTKMTIISVTALPVVCLNASTCERLQLPNQSAGDSGVSSRALPMSNGFPGCF